MRIVFIAAFAAAVLAAPAPASAQTMTLTRSDADCAIRAVPAATRAEFRRVYPDNPTGALDILFAPAVRDLVLACVRGGAEENGHGAERQTGFAFGNLVGAYEMMNASAAHIATMDAGLAGSLDAAYGRLTPAQRAALVISGGCVGADGGAATRAFLSFLNPAMSEERKRAEPRLANELSVYAASRATYESMVSGS